MQIAERMEEHHDEVDRRAQARKGQEAERDDNMDENDAEFISGDKGDKEKTRE